MYQIDHGTYTSATASLDQSVLAPCSGMSVVAGNATSTTYSFQVNNKGVTVVVTQDGIQ
jgi:hypothetical protein